MRPLVRGHWSTSLIWGRNHDLEYTQQPGLPVLAHRLAPRHIVSVPTRIPGQIYNSFLAESTLRLNRNWIWGRAESADKDSTLLFEEAPLVLLVDEQRLARVQAYTSGYEREFPFHTGLERPGDAVPLAGAAGPDLRRASRQFAAFFPHAAGRPARPALTDLNPFPSSHTH